MLTKLATFSGTAAGGEPLAQVFHPGDGLEKFAGVLMPEIQKWLKGYTKQPDKIAIVVNALGASEYWGQNVNGDLFPESALLHDCRNHPGKDHPLDDFVNKPVNPYGYWTFKYAHTFAHHKNKDPSRAFGTVEVACWNPRMHRVELIVLLDRAKAMQHGAQHIIDRIDAGEFPDVSMGCKVPYDVCTICGNKSKTRNDYCSCIKHIGMGKILDDGRRIGVINLHPRFFDISFVFIGADKTAKMMCKLASGLWVPSSVIEGEVLYGAENEDPHLGLTKAASVQMPVNLVKVAGSVSVPFGASAAEQDHDTRREGTGRTHTLSKSLDSEGKVVTKEKVTAPAGEETTLILGRNDEQDTDTSVHDGALYTNMEGADSSKNKEAASRQSKVMRFYRDRKILKPVFNLARKMKLGPPPQPNRKEFPFVGTLNFRGIEIGIENAAGTWRSGKGWKTLMEIPYGEFLHSKAGGVDGDKLDVYVGPFRKCKNVFIIHQNHVRGPGKGEYDEDKVMLGFQTAEQAKAAYLFHYDSDKYFRSITVMAFPLFKRSLIGGQMDGEKVASYQELTKTAKADMKLEDLFDSAVTKGSRRRERTWKVLDGDGKGKNLTITGSGLATKEKTASIQKTAEPFTALELLKLSQAVKEADLQKWSDIVKEIGPSKAVGKVSPLLSAQEPTLPKSVLDILGRRPLEQSLSTPSMMGMVLKPREFQRIALTSMGKQPLADEMDRAGAVFKPSDHECAPCGSLGKGNVAQDLMRMLLPMMGAKSYLGPVLKRRIVRITMVLPSEPAPDVELNSPLLTKVAGAYNWYRREQMKLAADTLETIPELPELHQALYGLGMEDVFKTAGALAPSEIIGKGAENFIKGKGVNPQTLAVILGSIPITMMYSAHLRGKQRKGQKTSTFENIVADHPWVASLGTAAGLRQLMKSPQAEQLVDEVFSAGKRVWYGKGGPAAHGLAGH
jgi:hypothetical protein